MAIGLDKTKPSPRLTFAIACVLLIGQWLLAWTASLEKSVTFDEIAHVTSGISYWQNDDYRLNPENGNLPQRWVALPAWLRGARLPPGDYPAWQESDLWRISDATFYKTQGQDHWPILASARAMNACLMTGISLLIFLWVRHLWGNWVGLLTLLVVSLDPNFLAHGALATSDMAATLLLPTSLCIYWWHIKNPSWKSLPLSIAVFGLACVAKFSAVLLIPGIFLLVILRIANEPSLGRLSLARKLLLDGLTQILGIVLIIWSFYGFRYAGPNPLGPPFADYYRSWSAVLGDETSIRFKILEWLQHWKILPEAFIYGGGYVAAFSAERLTFFRGEIGLTGWLWFFPYVFLVKTPLATLGLMLTGACASLLKWHKSGLRSSATAQGLHKAAPLLIWSAIYLAASLATNLNIGHRHLLPLYPGLFVLCGAAIYSLRRHHWILAVLMAFLAAESFLIRPHYISYFNPIDGGPKEAWTKVVDSSLDWGQDLPGTARWLSQNTGNNERVYLAYFGTGDPSYYKIRALTLQKTPDFKEQYFWYSLRGGLYVISSTLMQQNLASWSPDELKEYQITRKNAEDEIKKPSPKLYAVLSRLNESRLLILYDQLRAREPVQVIGNSIRIYRLNDNEARDIDFGLLPPPEKEHDQSRPQSER